ncbi:MAG: hypothetical protein PHQ72_05950 [Hespellia sp.]|nr:hypothetical protein [Hespellia sp.]
MKQKQVLEIIYEGKTVKVKKSWLMRILRKIFRVNRKQKDRLFLKVFSEKKALLDMNINRHLIPICRCGAYSILQVFYKDF